MIKEMDSYVFVTLLQLSAIYSCLFNPVSHPTLFMDYFETVPRHSAFYP